MLAHAVQPHARASYRALLLVLRAAACAITAHARVCRAALPRAARQRAPFRAASTVFADITCALRTPRALLCNGRALAGHSSRGINSAYATQRLTLTSKLTPEK